MKGILWFWTSKLSFLFLFYFLPLPAFGTSFSGKKAHLSEKNNKNCMKTFGKNSKNFDMPALIEKKALGKSHSLEEISYIVQGITEGRIPDYQSSAWLMAVRLKGASREETGFLTKSMTESGKSLTFKDSSTPIVDKHSTGGVGDKTSFIISPLCASCDLKNPMISGRGLGHTGGTLDKLESLPGVKVNLSLPEIQKQTEELGVVIAAQTKDLAPADGKIYALRDVTSTVNSQPLIVASIMSKKLAESLDVLVMDVKFGSGAFMQTLEEARQLAEELKYAAEYNGVKFRAVISNMDQPLGRFIGNRLEVREVINILKNEVPEEQKRFSEAVKNLSLQLTAQILYLSGRVKSEEEGLHLAQEKLESGQAYEKFKALCRAQGGQCDLDDFLKKQNPSKVTELLAPQSGYIHSMNTKDIGMAGIALGAGRKEKGDSIDSDVGIEMQVRLGDYVSKGEPLATFYHSANCDKEKAEQIFLSAISFSENKPENTAKLIEELIR